jgi:TonB family protein
MSPRDLSPVSLAFLVSISLKITFLLTFMWIAASFSRKQSAAFRHILWTAGILSSLALPVFSFVLPGWHSLTLGNAAALWAPTRAIANAVQIRTLPAMLVDARVSSFPVASPTTALVVAWAGGALLFAIRFFIGLARIAWLSAHAKPFTEPEWLRITSDLSNSYKIARPVALLQCTEPPVMPITWGIFHPRILLPQAARDWTSQRQRIVLVHELAHIARCDCLWQICAELMRAFYWFHPLAWMAIRKLRHESERACDDRVLGCAVDASDYAAQLIDLARTLRKPARGWAAALALTRPSRLERRLVAMLNSSTNRRRVSRGTTFVIAIAAALLLLPLAAIRLPAQNTSGNFGGTVRDPSSTGVRNATVIMSNANAIEMTTTDAEGNFSFKVLSSGEYQLKVVKRGFEEYRAEETVPEPARECSLNITLKVGAVLEEVDVVPDGTVKPLPESDTGGKPARLRLGGDIEAPKLVTKVQPTYPQKAKAAGAQGTVILHAIIGMDGKPLSLRVMNKEIDPDLARASVEAVSQWRYTPTLLNGEPIEVDTTIMVNFTLSR